MAFYRPRIGRAERCARSAAEECGKKYGQLDNHLFYAADTPISVILDAVQNGSLFAEARFAVVRNAEAIKKKEDIHALTQWVEQTPAEDGAFIVLISDEIGIDKKIEALVPKDHKKIFWELFENKKQEWLRRFFAQSKINIEQEAIEVLLELVENNTEALKTACTHISLFFEPGTTLTAETVERLLAHNKEETPFTLFDALSNANLEYALNIRQKLTLSKESSPVQLIAGLTYCFRRLRDWHTLAQTGGLDDFSLKKAGFTSKKAIEQYRRASRQWNEQTVHRIISLLNKTDMQIRAMGQELSGILLDACLYSIICNQGRELAAYSET
ncbi:DNA polymerase III, delta subunit [Treponema vincentii ATCC 35580]|uniref:DNA-directed DNA polymerase n=1 Tax=Treponema vincentii ATCC 35580 TaxID=596324 RepID=C8PQV8_9SPIR|nr:DNA polymerase III subunit delta [Treponema vincentii]EEV20170.1 DNA polymerase III, delta subunit [Treponema vincentii ATCC 35580]